MLLRLWPSQCNWIENPCDLTRYSVLNGAQWSAASGGGGGGRTDNTLLLGLKRTFRVERSVLKVLTFVFLWGCRTLYTTIYVAHCADGTDWPLPPPYMRAVAAMGAPPRWCRKAMRACTRRAKSSPNLSIWCLVWNLNQALFKRIL